MKQKWAFVKVRENNNIQFYMVIDEKGDRILLLNKDEYGYGSEEEVEANGRLIAAAPELLSSLQTLVTILEDLNPSAYQTELSKANVVISKIKKP